MGTIAQLLVSGISQGCVYGLIALGFVLIYKSSEMINFAQGELTMLGAFFAVTYCNILGFPFLAGVACTLATMAFVGVAMERTLLRPMIGEPQFSVLMLTIGIGFVLRSVSGAIWGNDPIELKTPYATQVLAAGDVVIGYKNLVIVGAAVLACGVLYLFFKFSRVGVAMQAASQNQLAAYYIGIPVKRIIGFTWAMSAVIAGLAGVLLAPVILVSPTMGFVGIKAFAAAIVGGFGSLPGAFLGGLAIGVVEQFGSYYLGPGMGETSAYILLIVMLLVRPQGLFAAMQRKKV